MDSCNAKHDAAANNRRGYGDNQETVLSPVACAEDVELRLNADAELARYFASAYLNGDTYSGQMYEKGIFAYGLPTFTFPAEGGLVHVWQYAFDLRALAPSEEVQPLFHYTNELGFRNVANHEMTSAELFASLTDKNAHFGQGLYATQYEPAVWGNKLRILLNNYTRGDPFREDVTDEKAQKAKQEWGLDRVSFCIPLIVPKSLAYNFWQRLTPDVQKRTTPEGAPIDFGMNVHGQKSHSKRDVWIVRVSDEFEKVKNPHVSADGITTLLKWRLQKLHAEQGDTDAATLVAIDQLSARLQGRGNYEDAEPLLREALEVKRRQLGDAHPETLISIANLGSLLKAMGKLDEAEPLLREALEGNRRQLGDTHPHTLISIGNLGSLLQDMGKLDEAAPLLREVAKARG